MNRVNILNIAIDNVSEREMLDRLRLGGVVYTPNVDHLMLLQRHRRFYQAYRNATYRICDSQVLMFVAWLFGTPLRAKLSGSDFFTKFYQHYARDESVTIFLLGAAPGVAQAARERINAKVGREIAIAAHSPSFGFESNEAECDNIIEVINRSRATVLAVGVGAPKQELWIDKYRSRLQHVRVIFAIGATLDFEAGRKPRAPRWVSQIGLEWLFRLLSEPRRLWRRYLVDDLPFVGLIVQQMLHCYRSPWTTPSSAGNVNGRVAALPSYKSLSDYRDPAMWRAASSYLQPIGQLLQQAGLLSSSQIELVLREQQRHPERRFGEILQRRRWAERQTVEFFLWSRHRSGLHPGRQRLGDYLTAAALLSEEQLESLLSEQSFVGLRLGELAVRRGWVDRQTVDWFLQFMGVTRDSSPLFCA
ncbi:MAG: WecB/TagA/CpsF family glycosyltransferase [Cyanobacteria bacterium P01_F01_bin.33]